MHNEHAWTERNEEGEKREVRAIKFGGKWRLQAKLKSDPGWTYYDSPRLEDLTTLRDILERKYQRRRASWEDVCSVDALIARAAQPDA